MVCLRVTRFCNASCGFCLAPPDGSVHPDAQTLAQRIDWLLARGVTTIHFCGGEPTIHRALPDLVEHVHARGRKTKLTTNGIAVPARLIAALRAARTEVRISLHGDREHHDRMVGRPAFDRTTLHLRRLLAAGVRTTTLVAGGAWVAEWVARFCLEAGVRRLSFLPFIPRGSGRERRGDFELSPRERRELRELASRLRRAHSGRLDVRWLDFTSRPFHVMEADGRLVLEGATEALDVVLA